MVFTFKRKNKNEQNGETISMTLEEDDKQINQNEINDKYLNKKYTILKMIMKMKLLKIRRDIMKKKRRN